MSGDEGALLPLVILTMTAAQAELRRGLTDGIAHYDVIVAELAVMHAHEPTLTHDDLGRISCRALVMVADDDEVRLEHAVELYRSLPGRRTRRRSRHLSRLPGGKA
jgi:hypothetical protein